METYSILQWNLNVFYNNLPDVKQIKLICLQEISLQPHHQTKFKNYDIYRFDYINTLTTAEGVAILIHETIIFKNYLQINMDIQNVIIRIRTCYLLQNMEFTVTNIYIPPHTEPDYAHMYNFVAQLSEPYTIIGSTPTVQLGAYKH